MVKDPVCGMKIEEAKAKATADHNGKTFYFCAPGCKDKFVKEPQKFSDGEASKGCC